MLKKTQSSAWSEHPLPAISHQTWTWPVKLITARYTSVSVATFPCYQCILTKVGFLQQKGEQQHHLGTMPECMAALKHWQCNYSHCQTGETEVARLNYKHISEECILITEVSIGTIFGEIYYCNFFWSSDQQLGLTKCFRITEITCWNQLHGIKAHESFADDSVGMLRPPLRPNVPKIPHVFYST